MSGDIGDISGAVGDIGLGVAAAKAVEPETDGATRGGREETGGNACLNCGTALIGDHCHHCGQKAKLHRTLRGFGHDLLHGILHFEGKFWRTMPLLFWRPGRVIREYVEGKRAKYVSPIALFLFTVFVSYALFSAFGGFGDIEPEVDPATAQELQANLEGANAELAKLNQDLAAPDLTAEAKAKLRREIAAANLGRDMLVTLIESAKVTDDPEGIIKVGPGKTGISSEAAGSANPDSAGVSDGIGGWLNSSVRKVRDNPGLAVYKLQTNAYKLSWLLIPLSLPFMWLLFPFSRRFKMYDHTVFVTYSISFMTMLAVILSVGIGYQFWPLIVGPLLYAPFHLYRSFRGAYGLSRFGALWRMVTLSAAIWLTLGLFITIMFGIVISG
ncbi:DUF3667 domain-containing protein [Pontixanthobacter aestiaquae]|uniref:DUF3667 domain-containing protein n=1 Tax=Pontixanthobacter aestiaquae TaxID=1509367 RepID=A0A844Z6J7_9SPHN|nr:DUF3667 domain-containing protein [Pontixanthobacter aestiaquae]MDN3646575.1 DUF3667 domain-containing protein [Pontixanthobacter aestiaquae]MXO82440.1 DUF3667 domain-containing protein [Pontixanthobacter aestiaquae]